MSKGFTLIEILVSMAIFSLVVGSVTQVFVSSIKDQRRGLKNQEMIDSINYTLEYASKALRAAKKQSSELPSCLEQNGLNYETTRGGSGVKFLNYQQECYEFYLDSGRIYQKKGVDVLPLTPSTLDIQVFKFEIFGESENDDLQPRVAIFAHIKSKEANPAELKIQTSVSQRELDTR